MRFSNPGFVTASLVEIRFPFSGKIAAINKKVGDKVQKGDFLASLDKKQLQVELDKELLDYEKVRKAFDKDHELQNNLDISVKNVELAKMRLDQADLISPVEGIVVASSLLIGLNATPAGNSIKIVDAESLVFEFDIKQADLQKFLTPQKVWVSFFKGKADDVEAETQIPVMGDRGKFKIKAKLPKSDKTLPGLEGEVSLI